ncbi:hypothetical protein GLOIN_2v1791645 [Rhizophagus irregularis DAOM 181602=DAOM 197198]|uniref:DUF8211 domain-containing protein n=1 Tax=Rhizophagus irregularis (strain DAOM 181602 / DAOM 197198 / MUCL 43194) TaxID=747089 RepID=A0A2P4NWP3_RHIID|nr:hypothetical protein GLOIN_2v1791645 [Rhizophagus irregularis DAOM 181602=DAOM 197198]POG57571.1 hypothetical protein GLOIN_2v1791645 [Rhizophagus irregularis DAOM 181602=DAOM 197198]|eukprot:XP_025164437.1 hypothetical protein GLOIN_2v1791645 [Rhizophagus irregularis DAOM 181602=DAOM 197198]
MTSSNSIVIDWSASSSTHSFIRIDDPSFSQDISLYPTTNIDSQVSPNNNNDGFPIKDFSSISPISSTTTPLNVDNSFLISFKKFHVTRIHKTGYNKIYKFRRSKSFFFEIVDHHLDTNQLHLRIHTNDYLMSTTPIKYHSTSALPNAKYQISKGLQHFFSSQRVIPRRIQHKYFDMIRQKLLDRITFIKSRKNKFNNNNAIMKTFFNFSYKRYRFHFGIFLPCNHIIEAKGLSIPPRPCEVPSPIVMSNNRHGCGLHFFKKYPNGIVLVRDENGDFTPKNQHQNKQLHANLTFDRWIKKESKSIFSSRTGISYNSRYIVCNSNRKFRPGHTYIYHKLMNNFQITPSPNPRTARNQKIRFKRSYRRILSQEVIKPCAVSSTSKTVDIPKQKDYNFTIPHYFGTNTNTTNRLKASYNISITTATTSASVLNNEILYTVAPYNPIPDMFIPVKYQDIIPPDPIYDNLGSFIIPGSREWFTYMYQLDLETRDERLGKADDAKFAARMDELYAKSVASKLRYKHYLEERSKEITALQIQEEIRIQDLAIYHGTSPKHVKYWQRQVSDLTEWNNTYHTYMSTPQCIRPSEKKKKKKSKKKNLLQSEMDSFLINYPNASLPFTLKCNTMRSVFDYKDNILPTKPYTSDDTKELENRPLKRDDHNFDNNSRSFGIPKCSRLDTLLALDSKQAGSSK